MTTEVEALLARLEDEPDDVGAYLVLADALMVAGDPRAELIQLSLGLELPAQRGADFDLWIAAARRRALIAKERNAILGRLANKNVSLDYRLGFLDAITARGPAAGASVAAVLRAPEARLLRSITTRFEGRDGDAQTMLELAAALPVPRALRRLSLEVDRAHAPDNPADEHSLPHIAMYRSHVTHPRRGRRAPEARPSLDDVSTVLTVFPNLTELVVDLGLASLAWAPLRSPHLRRFTWVTPYADPREVVPIAASELPALEAFTMWVGARHVARGAQDDAPPLDRALGAIELAPVIAMLERCPALRELGLCNVGHAFGEIAAVLAASPMLAHVEVLDLTLCDLFEHRSDVLAIVRAAPRLARIRVSGAALPDAVVAELAARVTVEGNHDNYRPSALARYRHVHEPW